MSMFSNPLKMHKKIAKGLGKVVSKDPVGGKLVKGDPVMKRALQIDDPKKRMSAMAGSSTSTGPGARMLDRNNEPGVVKPGMGLLGRRRIKNGNTGIVPPMSGNLPPSVKITRTGGNLPPTQKPAMRTGGVLPPMRTGGNGPTIKPSGGRVKK